MMVKPFLSSCRVEADGEALLEESSPSWYCCPVLSLLIGEVGKHSMDLDVLVILALLEAVVAAVVAVVYWVDCRRGSIVGAPWDRGWVVGELVVGVGDSYESVYC